MAAVTQALGRQALGMACTCTWQALGRERRWSAVFAAAAAVAAARNMHAPLERSEDVVGCAGLLGLKEGGDRRIGRDVGEGRVTAVRATLARALARAAAARVEVQAAVRTQATVVRACASRRATRSPVAAGLAAAAVLTWLVVWAQGGDGSQCERRAAHGGAA